jgi:predicted ribosome quality control (RQC) complex YloA/Tae2 family protein
MGSPMDECDNIVNIDPSQLLDTTLLKRKLDSSSDELSLPSKKVAVLLTSESGTQDVSATGATPLQVKLTRAERDALKLEKVREREIERQRRDLERQRREEEKLKREEERLKKVPSCVYRINA